MAEMIKAILLKIFTTEDSWMSYPSEAVVAGHHVF